jgi:hypothetical protein
MIANRKATLVVSIDLQCDSRLDLAARKDLDGAATTLLGLLKDATIHATWGAAFPAHDAWTSALVQRHTGHEIALLGDATWIAPTATRTRFAMELSRRLSAARAAGIKISSLLLTGADLSRDWDIAVKHGLTAIRPAASNVPAGGPSSLRYGLWRVPSTVQLTDSTRRFLRPASRTIVRAIDAAVFARGLCHLVIDATKLSRARERALRAVFAHVVRQRIAGRLTVRTLASLVADLTCPRQAQIAARSILRDAA